MITCRNPARKARAVGDLAAGSMPLGPQATSRGAPEERPIIVYFNDRLPAHPNHPICALAVGVPLVATGAQIGYVRLHHHTSHTKLSRCPPPGGSAWPAPGQLQLAAVRLTGAAGYQGADTRAETNVELACALAVGRTRRMGSAQPEDALWRLIRDAYVRPVVAEHVSASR